MLTAFEVNEQVSDRLYVCMRCVSMGYRLEYAYLGRFKGNTSSLKITHISIDNAH